MKKFLVIAGLIVLLVVGAMYALLYSMEASPKKQAQRTAATFAVSTQKPTCFRWQSGSHTLGAMQVGSDSTKPLLVFVDRKSVV